MLLGKQRHCLCYQKSRDKSPSKCVVLSEESQKNAMRFVAELTVNRHSMVGIFLGVGVGEG